MSQIKVNAVTDASGGNTATINSMTPTADSLQGFRNRLINGNMMIDQRNAGASVTPTTDATYTLDRWCIRLTQASKVSVQQNAGSVASLATTGFNNYLGVTSTSSFSASSTDIFTLAQHIEGNNVQDLRCFWIYSSKTGTFGGSVFNNAANRSYPFTFTISAANTWEYETVTIPGDTSGSWTQTTGVGIYLNFDLGSGTSRVGTAGAWAGATYWGASGCQSIVATSGATFYITGVQLEVGSVATPFERRDYGRELILCKRYFQMLAKGNNQGFGNGGFYYTSSQIIMQLFMPVEMRGTPTLFQGTGTDYFAIERAGASDGFNGFDGLGSNANTRCIAAFNNTNVSGTAGVMGQLQLNNASAYVGLSAEL